MPSIDSRCPSAFDSLLRKVAVNELRRPSGFRRAFDKAVAEPLRPLIALAGVLVAVGAFVGVVAMLGGPVVGDASASLYSTWAIQHGQFACAYPPFGNLSSIPGIARPITAITPLYPLLSGAIAALVQVGHGHVFPSGSFGPSCAHAYVSIFHWSEASSVANDTLRIGYISGIILLGGALALLRVSGRGRRLIEPVTLIAIATLAPVLAALVQYFHPQDVMALGLTLFALSGALQRRWVRAGVLIGLAIVTQQYALLVFASLLFAIPSDGRWRYIVSAACAAAIVDIPFLIVTTGRALRAIVSGSAPSYGGTVLWEMRIPPLPLYFLARILPILLAGAIGWYVRRRVGDRILQPTMLISLAGTSFAVRLVLEVNLWGYYFMALAVSIVLLEVVRGRVRTEAVAWLLTLTLAFSPIPGPYQSNTKLWDIYAQLDLGKIVVGAAALYVIVGLIRRRIHWFWIAWVVFAAIAFVHLPGIDFLQHQPWPRWLWQVLLVPSGLALVSTPLVTAIRNRTVPADDHVGIAPTDVSTLS